MQPLPLFLSLYLFYLMRYFRVRLNTQRLHRLLAPNQLPVLSMGRETPTSFTTVVMISVDPELRVRTLQA